MVMYGVYLPRTTDDDSVITDAKKNDNIHVAFELEGGKIIVFEQLVDYGNFLLCFKNKQEYISTLYNNLNHKTLDWVAEGFKSKDMEDILQACKNK